MNVGELRKFLAQFPDDMEILYEYCSDYELLEDGQIRIMKAVNKNGYWMRAHPTMSDENKAQMKDYLVFPGN